MELTVYYLFFCIMTAVALFVASKRHSTRRHWELTPEVILVISFFAYTSAMPLSRFLWGTESTVLDIPFLRTHLLGLMGLVVGLIAGKLLSPPKTQNRPLKILQPVRCAILAAGSFVVLGTYIFYSVGLSLSNLLRPYGYEASLNPNLSTFDQLLEPAVAAMILHCYLGAFRLRTRKPLLHRFVLAIVALVTALLLMRGTRNPVLILCLPLFGIAFFNRRIPAFKATVAVAMAFITFSIVAAVRNYGLLSSGVVPIGVATLDPLHGELGTSYNVFTVFNSISYADELEYGKTYTVDLGLNMVPHALWPNRPPTAAVAFSMKYYGTEDLHEGLGFSPVVEAMANYGETGIPFVFAAFAFGVVALANYLSGKGRWGLLSYAMMLPMLVNWNRIDSNASVKMFAVYVVFFIIIDLSIYRRGVD